MDLPRFPMVELLDDGSEQLLPAEGSSFTFGSRPDSDYELPDNRALPTHAEIKYDSNGQPVIFNYSQAHPVLVDDVEVTEAQPLTKYSLIKIFAGKFVWVGYELPPAGALTSQFAKMAQHHSIPSPIENSTTESPSAAELAASTQKRAAVDSRLDVDTSKRPRFTWTSNN